jgi:predicted nicotinamide N-methyase
VLDVASGSGLVAIAAAKAGAASVEAADIDAFAIEAIAINAVANAVAVMPRLADLVGTDEGWDVVLTGDIFYERDVAAHMWPWLAAIEDRGARVLIGDPGRSYLPQDKLEQIAEYRIQVTRDLEDADIKLSRVWRIRRP